ncbi:hypothetical protein [Silvimonas iriomotensis]|uniref:Alpha/beta hydrolase n=1 Tax=Silvimonas iriomotensis TaxID=449662 RepID=A0ABQ2PAN2_9NEIS|nr:hypothetical protein [Silvimonas iriomotensis]GGP22395.1 hypothetical protein GCM10010970_25020 [Silvimonas iriomotensis]
MNKFAASLVFAAVAATAAFSAQAADNSHVVTTPTAQQGALPVWQRASHATQNFASQIDQQPGHTGVVLRPVAQEFPASHASTRGQAAAYATQNFASQIDQQPGRVVAD